MAKIKVEEALKKRVGICGTCENGSFQLKLHKHQLLRLCPRCLEVMDPDTGEIIRKGRWV